MRRFATGVTVGKFWPLHRGHEHLIDEARRSCDHLWVLVCGRAGHDVPLDVRASWVRRRFTDVTVVDVDQDTEGLPDDGSEIWARYTVRRLGFGPEAAFTSEPYGEAWATAMGAVHVPVDPDRSRWPVSGTAVRADPFAHWDALSPPVRAWYALRVCLIGAECTGKTTLARELADRYRTVWVPEWGRLYEEALPAGHVWTVDDFVAIAVEHRRLEDAAAGAADRVAFVDTDSVVTQAFAREYLGAWPHELDAMARQPDLYVFCQPDIPFVQDGLRDAVRRLRMHDLYEAHLGAVTAPVLRVSGTGPARLDAVTDELRRRFGIEPPDRAAQRTK